MHPSKLVLHIQDVIDAHLTTKHKNTTHVYVHLVYKCIRREEYVKGSWTFKPKEFRLFTNMYFQMLSWISSVTVNIKNWFVIT